MVKYDKLVNLFAEEKILKNKKFYKIILLTYKSQVIEYSKIARAMQGGQCLPFLCYLKEVMFMLYHPMIFLNFMKIG